MSAFVEEVKARADKVRAARQSAIGALNAKWFGGDEAENAIEAIKGMPIDAWAERGENAAAKDKDPGNGWPKWISAGQVFLDGIDELYDLGDKGRLENLKTGIKEAPVVSAKAAEKIVKKTAKAVGSLGEAAAGIVSSTIRPLLLPVIVLGGVAAAVFYFARRA